jgi:hypothetical protein
MTATTAAVGAVARQHPGVPRARSGELQTAGTGATASEDDERAASSSIRQCKRRAAVARSRGMINSLGADYRIITKLQNNHALLLLPARSSGGE